MVQAICLSLVLPNINAISAIEETHTQSARITDRYRKIITFLIKILTFNYFFSSKEDNRTRH